jgi:hypothetical protein
MMQALQGEDDLIRVGDKKAIRLRSEIIPVMDVSALLNLPSAGRAVKNRLLVIVVRLGNEKLGLINEISAAIEAIKKGANDYILKDENIQCTVIPSVKKVLEKYKLKQHNISGA